MEQLQQIDAVQRILEEKPQQNNSQIQAQLGQYEEFIQNENAHLKARLEQYETFIEDEKKPSRQIHDVRQI